MKKFNLKIKKGNSVDSIVVNYDDNWLSGDPVHFEFHGKATSETGYKSLFVMKEEMKDRTPEEFISQLLKAEGFEISHIEK